MHLAVVSRFMAAAWLAFVGVSPTAAAVEKPAALDGTQYTVIAPVYDGSGGALSYIRLFNGGTQTSTFKIIVVDATTQTELGEGSISVLPNASVQYPLTSAGGGNSILSQIGIPGGSPGASYALYLQNTGPLSYLQNAGEVSGYQHVIFNQVSKLFENSSSCAVPINQQFASRNSQIVTNVHSSQLSGYPSNISIHNHSSAFVTLTIAVYDAGTGASLGQFDSGVVANGTLVMAESAIESQIGFHPTPDQPHINLVVTRKTGSIVTNQSDRNPPVEITHTIHNEQLHGDINMSATCAINAVVPDAVPYCGTSYLANEDLTSHLVIAMSRTGTIRGVVNGYNPSKFAGNYNFSELYFSGSVSNNSFTATDNMGHAVTGTVQNGSISGSGNVGYVGTFTATAAGCN